MRDAREHIVALDGDTLNPGDLSWDAIRAFGALEVYDHTSPDQVVARAQSASVVLTNKVRLGRAILEALPRLRFIAVIATGYDVIDLDAARARDIVVSNVPSYATDSVAQHVFALLLALTNLVDLHDDAIRQGAWPQASGFTFWRAPLRELAGQTLGVVGLGRIGGRVAQIGAAFGMEVVTYTPSLAEGTTRGGARAVSLDELFQRADVISLNCPLTEDNHHMVDAARLAKMKPGGYLINTSRGALVDNDALADALRSGHLGGAGLDVVDGEPISAEHPLLDVPNLVITPHNAWTARASRQRLMDATVANIAAFLEGSPTNVVS